MRKKTLWSLAVLMLPVTAPAQNWVSEPARPGAAARSDREMREVMLAAHNAERAAFGVVRMDWNDRLADDARNYAKQLARLHEFRHSVERHGAGENLWIGSRLAYSYQEMVGQWLDERRDFRPGVMPDVSRSGNFGAVGHYTQIVWPTTTQVGCGVASDTEMDYLVCRYAPAGNVLGERLRRPSDR